MKINDYTEKEIRNRIISKVKPRIPRSRSPHQKGYIYIGNKMVAKVKIPNDHVKVMKESKSQYIAFALRLSAIEFNDLIDCTLTGTKYYEIIRSRI